MEQSGTFEQESSDSVENPLGAVRSEGAARKNRNTVLPEYDESDGNLAQPVESEDLFEVLTEASAGRGLSGTEQFELMFKDVTDWDAPIAKTELQKMMETSLQTEISNQMLTELFRQVNTNGDEAVSARELNEWLTRQEKLAEDLNDDIDSHQAQIKRMQAQVFIIDPNSEFRGNWDMVQAVLLMYIAVIVPYRIGFDDNVTLWSFFFFFDLCIDIYFVADLCLNFRTAVITMEGVILCTPKEIADNYSRGWFPIDFVSCLPFSYAEYFVTADDSGGNNNRAVRLLRLVRLLKLLRLVRIKRILDRWEEEMYGASMLKVGKLIFLIFASSHWVACLWYAAGAPGGDQVERDALGNQIDGWVSKKYPTYYLDENGANETVHFSYLTRYYDAIWWASMAVLMVGAETDDINDCLWDGLPQLWSEKIVYGIAMVAGAFIMSVLIGSMSDIISHSNPGEKRKNDAISVVKGFLHETKMPPLLTRRIRAHFSLLYTMRGTTADFREIFDLMPRELANELAANMRFIDDVKTGRAGLMHNVPFFNSLEVEDLIRIGCRLRPHRASVPMLDDENNPTGGQIMRQGVRGTEMWLVLEGEVRVERGGFDTGAPRQILGKLRFGEYFGELAVLIEETRGVPVRYTRSAYAVTSNCVLMVLSHWDMVLLRRESEALDAAVVRAVEKIRAARPSLFPKAPAADDVVYGNEAERLSRLEANGARLEQKIDRLLAVMGEQATSN